jgi:aerobic carbon-monoxide dehydrogenase medium subunit
MGAPGHRQLELAADTRSGRRVSSRKRAVRTASCCGRRVRTCRLHREDRAVAGTRYSCDRSGIARTLDAQIAPVRTMKPAPFDYQSPRTLREAIDLLVSNPEALVIAGGQSLMPVLAFRLATPSLLVDLRRVPGLGNIAVGDDGFRLGAVVRWRDIEDDQRLVTAHPLLRTAIAHVAHYPIRNRGTVGGGLAHADPAAELPGVAVTCEGEITLCGPAGSRTARAADFFTGPLSTLRQPGEIITELYLPKWPSGRRWAFRKYARREGDFALAGILLFYDEDTEGALSNAHVGVIGACPRPHRLTRVETLLNGHAICDDLIQQAAATAPEEVDPPGDLHADAVYRRGLVATLVERGLRAAVQRGSA